MDLESWESQADVLLIMAELHDEKYRQTHTKPNNANIYPDGKWTSKDMVKSRLKDKDIQEVVRESLKKSPFLPKDIREL